MSETIQKTVDPSVKYKRVIIKISGEALAKENGAGIDNEKLEDKSSQSKTSAQMSASSSAEETFGEDSKPPIK